MRATSHWRHDILGFGMEERHHNRPHAGEPASQAKGSPRLLDVAAAAVEHSRLFVGLLTLEKKARSELEVATSLDSSSPGVEAVLEAARSASGVASLAVRLVEPSQREISYRAFSDLYFALDKIHALRIAIAEGKAALPANPHQSALVRRCSDIEQEVIESVVAYTRAVIPELLRTFFTDARRNEPGQQTQQGELDSIQLRETRKIAVGDAVLNHPALRELPPLPALDRLVTQGVVGVELLCSLTDQLLAAPRPCDTRVMSDVLEEFMSLICEARGCYERSCAAVLALLTEPQQQQFKEVVAPLDELLEAAHARFTKAWMACGI